MASPQYYNASLTTSYCAFGPVYEYVNLERGYETAPQQEYPLYDSVGACSPTAAPTVRPDQLDIEEELSNNYLSLGQADAPDSLMVAGLAPGLATNKTFPTQEDIDLSQILGSLHFDYVDEPVYQIGNSRSHVQDAPNFDQYAALALRGYNDTYTSTPQIPTYVAPADLHKPSTSYIEPSSTIATTHTSRAGRTRSRESSTSPTLVTRHPPARSAPIVPGFTSLKRRNVQVDPSAAKAIGDSAVSSSDNEEENPWKCPYCPFVQKNKRGPDFRRHIATHIGDNSADKEKKRFLCCGVPFFDAAEHNVPQEIMHNPLSMNELDGMLMVGGCRHTFTRKDAYIRHLGHQAGRCFGDPHAWYQPGNKASTD